MGCNAIRSAPPHKEVPVPLHLFAFASSALEALPIFEVLSR